MIDDKAFINIEKITKYVFNFEYFEGKNRTIIFESVLGIVKLNAVDLAKAIKEAVLVNEAVKQSQSAFGMKYTLDFSWRLTIKPALYRTGWIIEENDIIARLVTFYVKL